MSDSLTALASENLNPSLRSLLEDVARGYILVPRFQRPFVWTDSQRLDLLRSVRDNIPIGSLLVWRTIKFKLSFFQWIGPHKIPISPANAPTTGWQYLLDGHQRVSTLLGLLLRTDISSSTDSENEDLINWNIQYDLMEQDFIFLNSKINRRVSKPTLPLWTIFDGRYVNRHMRELRKIGSTNGWTEADLDIWEERADQLSYRFQQCRIPIVVMVTDDLESAAKTFQRINSLGTPMNEAHLVAALTWRSDFDLREKVSEFRDELPAGWQSIDESIYLQVCKGLAGLDMTKSGQNELVKKLSNEPEILIKAGEGIKQAVNWLIKYANVMNQELLPYTFQVVLMAVEFIQSDAKTIEDENVLAWFWRTSWSEVFATGAYRQIKLEQERLKSSIQNLISDAPWNREQSLPDRFDTRSARARLVMLRIAAKKRYFDLNGTSSETKNILEKYGRDSLVRLFSSPTLASNKLKRLLQGAGNRFILDPNMHVEFKTRLLNGPDILDHVLREHFIEPEDIKELRNGNYELFITNRLNRIEAWDKEQWKLESKSMLNEDEPQG